MASRPSLSLFATHAAATLPIDIYEAQAFFLVGRT
jgi:hypothetical protein